MKTQINHFAGAALIVVSVFSACTNTSSNNASYSADTANKAIIEKKDTAKVDSITHVDSANKTQEKQALASVKQKKVLQENAAKFLVKAYEAGMYEVELGELAEIHTTNADVKLFAAQLVSVHKMINTKMLDIAFGAGFKLPGGIDGDHAKDLTKLEKNKGANFDKKFMAFIVSGYEKSVDIYSKADKELSAGDTKTVVSQTLPVIQQYLAMAKKLNDQLK